MADAPADVPDAARINAARRRRSTTLRDPLEWDGASVLQGDVAAAVAAKGRHLTILAQGDDRSLQPSI